MPSFRYRSASGDAACAVCADTSVTLAPSAISAGAVSVEDTARHFGLEVATQHVSPSFFMQKSIAFRHS